MNLTYHFVDLLRDAVAQLGSILLDLLDGRTQIIPQLLGRESQLANGHPDHSISLAVDRTSAQHLDLVPNIIDHSAHLHAGHQAPGTQVSTHAGLVHGFKAVGMTDAPIEINDAILHLVKDVLLSNQHSACFFGLLFMFRARGADDTDSGFGLDGMREADHVANDRAILLGLQSNVNLIFRDLAVTAYFEGPDVSG